MGTGGLGLGNFNIIIDSNWATKQILAYLIQYLYRILILLRSGKNGVAQVGWDCAVFGEGVDIGVEVGELKGSEISKYQQTILYIRILYIRYIIYKIYYI